VRNYLMILLILVAQTAFATVEETRQGPESAWDLESSSTDAVWPSVPGVMGELYVSVDLSGPKSGSDLDYTTPGKTLEYIVTVENRGWSEVDARLTINPKSCRPGWFGWSEKILTVPAGGVGIEQLQVTPDMTASPGDYDFQVLATASNCKSGSDEAGFKLQDYDYVSETTVSGSGQFQMNKDVRSMNTGVKSNKDIYFSGSVDALMKNEYLVEEAKGQNPTFQECDAVDNYMALNPGDTLMGTETAKSSLVFGGVGAKVQESYNLQEMEYEVQEIGFHHTGRDRRAEFQTADNFTGYLAIDSKQTIPGQRSTSEREEFLGSFEIQRRLIFKDNPKPTFGCFGGSCFNFAERFNALSS
jgi:hypothetical protein